MVYSLMVLFLMSMTADVQASKLVLAVSAGENINGLALKNPQGLAVNPRTGEFLVTDGLNNRIVIFDTTGMAVFSFPTGDDYQNPFGIAVNSEDEIIVSSMDYPKLIVYDYSGRPVSVIPLPRGTMPGRLITDEHDNIFLIDRAGGGILVLDKTGKEIKKILSPFPDSKPSGVSFDRDGNILLVSSAGDVVSVFTGDGKFAYSFGAHGRLPENFSHPTSIAVDVHGWIWIVDSFRHHIKRFDKDRMFIDIIGRRGIGPGEFHYPVDLKITPSGKLGVLEKSSGRLQIFRIIDVK